MNRREQLTHEFVEEIPAHGELVEGVLYISIEYATASHLCMEGCGKEVVTPLSPNQWELTFDGRTVSLSPSIGNWSFECQSHYWIRKDRVRWDRQMSKEAIARTRADRADDIRRAITPQHIEPVVPEPAKQSLLARLRALAKRS